LRTPREPLRTPREPLRTPREPLRTPREERLLRENPNGSRGYFELRIREASLDVKRRLRQFR
jgi:hypothetical protein